MPSRGCKDFRPPEARPLRHTKPSIRKSGVADLALTSFANRRDWQKFGEFYLDPELSGTLIGSAARRPVRPAGLHRADQICRPCGDRKPTSPT